MSTDAIEVMARAAFEAAETDDGSDKMPWEQLGGAQDHWTREQKAALSALASAGYRLAGPGECVVPEEPTEAMLEAGWNAGFAERYNATQAPMIGSIWDAMLSASQQKAPGS